MEMKLLISSALFLLVVALTEGSPTNLERRSFLKGVIRNTQRRPLNKIKKNKNNFLVRKTPVPQRPFSYRGGEPPHTNAYERPQYPTEEENKQFSPSQLYKLFGIRSAVAGAQQLFDKAIEETHEQNKLGGPLEQIESLIEEAEEELDQFEQHCIGIGLYDGGAPPIEVIGNKCYVYYEELKSYDESSDACKQTGGLLAEADTSPGSTWGSQIVNALGPGPESRVSGVFFEPGNMIFENSGLKINNNDDLWLTNNLGALSFKPFFLDISSIFLFSIVRDEEKWFLGINNDEEDLPYLCEYKLNYRVVSK